MRSKVSTTLEAFRRMSPAKAGVFAQEWQTTMLLGAHDRLIPFRF
jgi:hypothetical protein